jgi:hypothetical protein
MGAQRLRLNDRERIGGGPAFGMIGQSWDEARAMGDLCEARDDQPLRRAGIEAGREMARPINDLAEIGRMAVRPASMFGWSMTRARCTRLGCAAPPGRISGVRAAGLRSGRSMAFLVASKGARTRCHAWRVRRR